MPGSCARAATLTGEWEQSLRTFAYATSERTGTALRVVNVPGEFKLRLHLWADGDAYPVLPLTSDDLVAEMACGLKLTPRSRTNRGAWAKARTYPDHWLHSVCPGCARRAGEFPETQELETFDTQPMTIADELGLQAVIADELCTGFPEPGGDAAFEAAAARRAVCRVLVDALIEVGPPVTLRALEWASDQEAAWKLRHQPPVADRQLLTELVGQLLASSDAPAEPDQETFSELMMQFACELARRLNINGPA
jgi:hypothetical protein